MLSRPEPSTALPVCWFCDQRWGACTCTFPDGEAAAYDESTPGFDTGDMWITAPNVSECTRWFVNPIEVYGEPFVTWAKEQPAIMNQITEAKRQSILTWQKPTESL